VDRDPELGQRLDERGVLALRDREVHGMEEAVRRIVEGSGERPPRSLDEDVMERRGHALGTVPGEGRRHGFSIGRRRTLLALGR
jgi:hypothetical protein